MSAGNTRHSPNQQHFCQDAPALVFWKENCSRLYDTMSFISMLSGTGLHMRYHNPTEFVGVWSHGVAHQYFEGSHDFRFVFLPDGRGSFCHDGWWRYRLVQFYWHITPSRALQLIAQNAIISAWPHSPLQIPLSAVSTTLDDSIGLQQLTIPLVDEPNEYWRVSSDAKVAADLLAPDDVGACGVLNVPSCRM